MASDLTLPIASVAKKIGQWFSASWSNDIRYLFVTSDATPVVRGKTELPDTIYEDGLAPRERFREATRATSLASNRTGVPYNRIQQRSFLLHRIEVINTGNHYSNGGPRSVTDSNCLDNIRVNNPRLLRSSGSSLQRERPSSIAPAQRSGRSSRPCAVAASPSLNNR